MTVRPLQFAIAACGARIAEARGVDPATEFHRVCTDTRKLVSGDLFVALRGENFDGHEFVSPAIAAGAVAAIVEKEFDGPSLLVPNTRLAFGQIAAAHRREIDATVFGVAGSNGKTSTKDMLAAILRAQMPTHHSEASFNNDIGVPTSLLAITTEHQSAVIELGTNHPGELAPLIEIAAPQFGIITGIGREHLEFFGDLKGVAQEEGMLAELLPTGGKLFLYGDDDWSQSIAQRSSAPVVTVGFSEKNDWVIKGVEVSGTGTGFELSSLKHECNGHYSTPLLGAHQSANATLAIAAAAEMGLGRDMIAKGLAQCPVPAMRLQLSEQNGVRWLNDAYNANADSVKSALKTLDSLETNGKRFAVLGDMAELGVHAEGAHREAGEIAAGCMDGIIAIGDFGVIIADAARKSGLEKAESTDDDETALELLRSWVQPGDIVLLKASRAARLERFKDLY